MTDKTLFPLKIATGQRFCNRLAERELLQKNIQNGQHMLLMSPRRYGKSSLVHFVLNSMQYIHTDIDLFVAYDDHTICNRLCEGISRIINEIIPFSKKAINTVAEYFQSATVSFRQSGLALELNYTTQNKDSVGQVNELLKGLDSLLKKKSKKVVIFIDEFQDLAKAEHAEAFQGAIRNVAQQTQNIVFIFSGSSRRLLSQIFEDRSKPLYKLCKKIPLERIGAEHYYNYIQKAAESKWQRKIAEELITDILDKTEKHPFYVNMLCHELWQNEYLRKASQISQAWDQCLDEERRTIETELSHLTQNQLKLIQRLALQPETVNPLAQDFLRSIKLANSSAQRALEFLLNEDYVYKNRQGCYKLVDPLLRYALIKLANNQWS